VGCGRSGFDPFDGPSFLADTLDRSPDASVTRPNKAFITADTYSGNLGGIAGADAKCAISAVQAGLPGTFVAFLSGNETTPVNAIDRLSGSRGWVRVDGISVADVPSQIVNGQIFNPISLDQFGQQAQVIEAWTGAETLTSVAARRCMEWTSTDALGLGTVGSLIRRDSVSNFTNRACDQRRALLCFEIGHAERVFLPPVTSKRIFVSQNSWSASAGRSNADAVCESERTAASLTNPFLALLPLTGQTAVSRMSGQGLDLYQRTDGAVVGTLRESPRTFLGSTATGAVSLKSSMWIGASPSEVAATFTCGDWTTSNGVGRLGTVPLSGNAAFNGGTASCATPNSVLCVEQ
jgi:hypothetical protein